MKMPVLRTVSFLLAALLCFSTLSVSVFAQEESLVFDTKTYCGSRALLPFFYTEEGGTATLTDALETLSGDLILPEILGEATLKKISSGAFSDCKALTSVSIPESVTEIATDAFPDTALCIKGVKGSYAELFAAEQNIPFALNEVKGDAEKDGNLSIRDVTLTAMYLAGWDAEISQTAGDVNGDYALSILDVTQIAMTLAGWSTPTLFVLGDETAQADANFGYYPAAGYADFLQDCLKNASVVSLAREGASAKNTLSAPSYTTLFSELKKGDVVLLSYGIHDADSKADTYASAAGDYKTQGSFSYYLYEYYIQPILSRGATPVLATPAARRPEDGVTFTESTLHQGYPAAIRALASETGVALVDLTEETKELYTALGAEDNAYLNAWSTRDILSLDREHFSVLGAQNLAQKTADALENALPAQLKAQTANFETATVQTYLRTFGATAKNSVFTYSDGTTSETDDTTISDTSYSVPEGEMLVSATLSEGVRAIAPYAFFAQYELENLGAVLPSTLISIGDFAFHSCNSLWLDELPDNLAEIGNSAFYGCENIVLTELKKGITSIGEYAFYGCDKLEGMSFSAMTDTVPKGAFANCRALNTVVFHDFITTLGDRAFFNCEAITSLALPQELETLGARALGGTSLESLAIPASLKTLSREAFLNADQLDTLYYPLLATDWVAIERGADWYKNTSLSRINCYDGEVTVEGVILVDYHAYYSDFEVALTDAAANQTANADLTRHEKADARAAILIEDGVLTLKLLKNANLFVLTALSGTFTLDLQGHTIAFCTAGSHFELARDADIEIADTVGGGKVYKQIDSSSAQYLYNLPNTGSHLTISGGVHTCENNIGSSIAVRGTGTRGSRFEMHGGTLSASANGSSGGNAKAVQAPEVTEITGGALASKTVAGNSYTVSGVGTFIIRGGSFDSYTKYGNSMALFAGDSSTPTEVTIYDGTFTTHANGINGKHIAFSTATSASAVIYNGTFTVDSKKMGDSGACGIGTSGSSLIIYDAFVQGNSAGLQALGVNTTIYGGTYIGTDHGGAYFAHNGDVGTIAVLGGTFRFVLPEGQAEASTSGTGSAYFTGGGKIYIDSATFLGRQVAISNLAGTAEETTVYISRTTAPSWRVDSLHTVYFGRDMEGAAITGNGIVDRQTLSSIIFDEAYLNSIS